jgi:hypothetical protein
MSNIRPKEKQRSLIEIMSHESTISREFIVATACEISGEHEKII